MTSQTVSRLEWAAVPVVAIVLVVGGTIYWLDSHNWVPTATGKPTDATVFISTLIIIYTVFLTICGAILPQMIDTEDKRRHPWVWFMTVLLLGVMVVDLIRIRNSLGDLYATTNRALTPAEAEDAMREFEYYWFYLNVIVIGLLLITLAFLPRKSDR